MNGESVRLTHGFTITNLGLVRIHVWQSDEPLALELLRTVEQSTEGSGQTE